MSIKDSGSRTEFESGAVRDIQEGKGRCDLMPLDVIGTVYKCGFNDGTGDVLLHIANFQQTGEIIHLIRALDVFCYMSTYISWSDMFLQISIHFEEGAKKYGENNWQKGIPVKCYINSAVRHYLKWLRGDKDELHDRAFGWNILCCIWTAMIKPELNDYRKDNENDQDRKN